MDEVPHFRKADYPLHRVASRRDWDGHIFINLSRDTAAARARSSPICPAKFRPWRMQDLRLGHRIVYDVRANWKLIVQNYNECLHCPNLHPALNKLSHYLSGENEPLHAPTWAAGWTCGRASTRCRWTAPARARSCRGCRRRRSPARLLLRDLPEHAPQPAPRLHDGAHAVAGRARTGRSTSASGTSTRRSWRGRVSTPPTRSSSGI